MQVEFIEPALIELDDAIEFYNLQSIGLGDIFFKEVLRTIDLISNYPNMWSPNTKNTRRAVLRKFPYNLIYTVLDKNIFVIAVAHQYREPEYWINRI